MMIAKKNISDTEEYAKNLLGTESILTTSKGSGKNIDSLFAIPISKYDEKEGYYEIENPGWIKIDLNEPKEISYIRFLLWDNRGSEAKRQPSNRKYTYRLLIQEKGSSATQKKDSNLIEFLRSIMVAIYSWFNGGKKKDPSTNDQSNSELNDIVWTAIYENTLNPSNGWQEFFFEDGARMINAIKIQFFQNTSASTTHNKYTQLVSVQAFSQPTEPIKQLLNLDQNAEPPAPLPNLGFIRNRVIVGGNQDVVNSLVENEIINKVKEYISTAESNYPDLSSLRKDLEGSSRNAERADIEKQIQILNTAILNPIEAFDKTLSKRFLWYTIIAVILSLYGIAKEVVEIINLTNGKANPLSLSYWLDWMFRNYT